MSVEFTVYMSNISSGKSHCNFIKTFSPHTKRLLHDMEKIFDQTIFRAPLNFGVLLS